MATKWRWDPNVGRYRNASGRFMSQERALHFAQRSIDASSSVADDLAALVSNGNLSPADFRNVFRDEIKREYIRQYLSARGGLSQMTQSDWGRAGGMIADQYRYLERFVEEIASGNLTEGQISTRARMYIHSAREAFERGSAVGRGVPVDQLPDFPGSGNTECLTRCNCSWRHQPIMEDDVIVAWNSYWETAPGSDSCDTCKANSSKWAPFHIDMFPMESV